MRCCWSLGPENVFTAVALFNSKMAVVTFGGAYAVLAYMAQQAVEHYHWLKPGEMLVGLGFAETTPGPLISVVQFVGFMAAFRQPGALAAGVGRVLGGVLAMWSTFVPLLHLDLCRRTLSSRRCSETGADCGAIGRSPPQWWA